MKTTSTKIFLSLAILCLLSTAAIADNYEIDTVHSSVVFKIKHRGISLFQGTFTKLTGKFSFDPAKPETNTVEATVDILSISSGDEGRDEHLLGEDYFHVEKFAKATFKSNAWKKTGEKTYDVTGDLTLLGKTKPTTVKVEFIGARTGGKSGRIVGFEVLIKFNRIDYGMPENSALGNDVTVTVSVEGTRE